MCSTKVKTFRVILTISFVIAFGCTAITWCKQVTGNKNQIYDLVLRKDSKALEWWLSPPIHSHLQVYFFNYTNLEEFQSGTDQKLIVKEMGPYFYTEYIEKIDVKHNHLFNNSISYKERRTSHFKPKLSEGTESDVITIPNVLYYAMIRSVKHENFFVKHAVSMMFSSTDAKPFHSLDVKSILWGYEDPLVELLKTLKKDVGNIGMFGKRNGTAEHRFVIDTGENDITKLNKFISINELNEMDHWKTDECNKIDGTDGTLFPPNELDRKQKLQVFMVDLCRSFSLTYKEDMIDIILKNSSKEIVNLRYEISPETLDYPIFNNSYNHCYCNKENVCPPTGLYNATVCNKGVPIFLSFPHFYEGDKNLHQKIDGLKPDSSKHESYVDINPQISMPVDGVVRFQINIEVQTIPNIKSFNNLEAGDILPVMWFELSAADVPQDVWDTIDQTLAIETESSDQVLLRYAAVAVTICSLLMLCISCLCCASKSKTIHSTLVC